jgi:cobalamin synthase
MFRFDHLLKHRHWASKLPFPIQERKMPLLNIVVALIVVGVLLYLINRYIPMASSIKSILNVVIVVVVVVWLLQAFGLWTGLRSYRIG